MIKRLYRKRRQKRYEYLLNHWLLTVEARLLSRIPRLDDPALKDLVKDRVARHERFVSRAVRGLRSGEWSAQAIDAGWDANISRMYTKFGWRSGGEHMAGVPYIPKGAINPWAMYRTYQRNNPDRKWVSPWELRQIHRGTTRLDKGLILVQAAERQVRGGATLSVSLINKWLAQKNEAIKKARGAKRASLMIQRNRLERLRV